MFTFNPWTETWTRYQDMPHGRWYPTITTLPDGRALILGGWDETGGKAANPNDPGNGAPVMFDDQDVEVFDPAAAPGSAATTVVGQLPGGPGGPQYPDHRGLGLYPHVFVLPANTALGAGGHKVLIAGPLQWDSAVLDTTNWSWTDLPGNGVTPLSSDRSWGTAVLEPAGTGGPTKVALISGSNTARERARRPQQRAAPAPHGRRPGPEPPRAGLDDRPHAAPQHRPRPLPDRDPARRAPAHHRRRLRPEGRQPLRRPGLPVRAPPDGATGWMQVGSEADARTYHSTAVLLPDGRVLSAGDDRPEHIAPANRTAQIYEPPYLFKGARPRSPSRRPPSTTGRPSAVAVAGDPAAVTRAVLMRPSAVTHANDMNQRAIELTMSAQADGLTLTSPADATLAPPGYYMLFLLNAQGVPVGRLVGAHRPGRAGGPRPAGGHHPGAPLRGSGPGAGAGHRAERAGSGRDRAPAGTGVRGRPDRAAPEPRPPVREPDRPPRRREPAAPGQRGRHRAPRAARRPGRKAPVARATLRLRAGVEAHARLGVTFAAGTAATRLDLVAVVLDRAGNRTTTRATVGRGQVAAAIARSARNHR